MTAAADHAWRATLFVKVDASAAEAAGEWGAPPCGPDPVERRRHLPRTCVRPAVTTDRAPSPDAREPAARRSGRQRAKFGGGFQGELEGVGHLTVGAKEVEGRVARSGRSLRIADLTADIQPVAIDD